MRAPREFDPSFSSPKKREDRFTGNGSHNGKRKKSY
jgi:hypothetical protein